MKPFDLWLPAPISLITQRFGQNANDSYHTDHLAGHTAIDWAIPYGDPIFACVSAPVYSVINRNNPDKMRYRAVFQLLEVGDVVYEISYGHLDTIYVAPGTFVNAGEVLGTCGNTGTVYSGSQLVTGDSKNAGSKAGAHLHGPQVRLCRKVSRTVPGHTYLNDGNGIYYKNGWYYEVINYDNGFNGCIDPWPLFNGLQAKNAAQTLSLYSSLITTLQSLLKALRGK